MSRRLAVGLVLVATVSALLVTRDRISPPIETPPSATPVARLAAPTDPPLRALDCSAPVSLPENLDRTRGFAPSPDGLMLALVRHLDPRAFSRVLIKDPVDPMLQHIHLIDLRSLTTVDDIGPGVFPMWSGSGRYLSYHVPQGGGVQVPTDFVVFDMYARREIARVHTTDVVNATAAWDGDAFVYLDGADVRRWEPTSDRIMSTISAAYLPPAGFPVISADGRAFANMIGSDGTAPVNAFVIEASTGRAIPLTGVRGLEWSKMGHRLLVSYDDHRELIDEDGTIRR